MRHARDIEREVFASRITTRSFSVEGGEEGGGGHENGYGDSYLPRYLVIDTFSISLTRLAVSSHPNQCG